jgi:peptidoglycan/xylan/chitin deacetylase (PgdA/CDA1 family)
LRYAAASVDVILTPHDGVTILIYHRVGARTPTRVDLPVASFDAQMRELAEQRRVVTIDRALELLDDEGPKPYDLRRPIVITFDDGTADWTTDVLPVLDRYQLPATFYVATDFVERSVPFPDDGTPISWDGLRDLQSSGLATFGSHTHTHALLDRAEPDTVRLELDRSKALIEDRLGVACDHFAYPKALPGSEIADAEVRKRFRSAVLAGTRPNRFGQSDAYCLARTPVTIDDTGTWFTRKAAGGLWLEDSARRKLNRRRYATATS